jgi:hypothetical protein
VNAIELHHADGRTAGVWYCEKCKCVSATKFAADECCLPRKCACGKECEPGWAICEECRESARLIREAQRFEKAEKLTEWDGHLFIDGFGSEYFDDIDAIVCDWECGDGDTPPAYAYACKKTPMVDRDSSDVVECIEGYEDWDGELNGVEELEEAIQKFNKANADKYLLEPDYSKVILLDPSLFAES